MKARKPTRVILFDIDGTLLRTHGAGLSSIRRTVEELIGGSLNGVSVNAAGRTDNWLFRQFCEAAGLRWSRKLRREILARYPSILKEELKKYRGVVLPGVLELLNELQGDPRFYLGICTGNIREGALIKLRHFGLEHYFHDGGYAGTNIERVPIVKRIVEKLQRRLKPSRMIYVGDTPFDILGGREAGCETVAVATGPFSITELQRDKPDLVIPDLRDPRLRSYLSK